MFIFQQFENLYEACQFGKPTPQELTYTFFILCLNKIGLCQDAYCPISGVRFLNEPQDFLVVDGIDSAQHSPEFVSERT